MINELVTALEPPDPECLRDLLARPAVIDGDLLAAIGRHPDDPTLDRVAALLAAAGRHRRGGRDPIAVLIAIPGRAVHLLAAADQPAEAADLARLRTDGLSADERLVLGHLAHHDDPGHPRPPAPLPHQPRFHSAL